MTRARMPRHIGMGFAGDINGTANGASTCPRAKSPETKGRISASFWSILETASKLRGGSCWSDVRPIFRLSDDVCAAWSFQWIIGSHQCAAASKTISTADPARILNGIPRSIVIVSHPQRFAGKGHESLRQSQAYCHADAAA